MRWLRHFFAPSAASRFPEAALERIAGAIAQGERSHTGQVCFAVEARLPPHALWNRTDARTRADEVFGRLRVWDTAANNGVLVYLLLADHRIEIVADRGLRDETLDWTALCERMASMLRSGQFEAAALLAVNEVTAVLTARFPRAAGDTGSNELGDRPRLLE